MSKRTTISTLVGLGVAAAGVYRYRRALFARLLDLPPAQYDIALERDLPVPMPDGTTLLADRYYPTATGDFPTILVRTPYGRAGELGAFGFFQRLIAGLFVERGYQVVVQGVRGRYHSEGTFYPFANEAADGQATLEWISRRPWFNGIVGMWGASYLGYTQWSVAGDAPPFLKALMPITTSSRFSRLFYTDGAFSLDGALRWSYLVSRFNQGRRWLDVAALRDIAVAYRPDAFATAFNRLPVNAAAEVALGEPVDFYHDWLTHPDLHHHFWQTIDHPVATGKVSAQVHLIASWYDIFLRDQLTDYAALLAAGRTPYLTIGPQHHLETSLIWDGIREGLDWFAVHLKGDQSRLRKRPVRVYVMCAHEWHEMDFWPPPATTTRYFLHAAAMLTTHAAAEHSPPDHYRYDPADPTPVVGGPLLNLGAGPRDQRALEARPDVLTFTTTPLHADIDVIGPVRLELYVCSNRSQTDFVGRLCDVYPDGRSINVCDGLFRVAPGRGDPQPDGSLRIDIDMWATAQRFCKGHRIRLQIASGAHPRWSRNLGTDEPVATGTHMEIAEQTIYHDAAHPSALVLPVVAL